MPHPYLLCCPYLPLSPDELIAFADWELGSLESFNDQWADSRFRDQSTAFLKKFVGPNGERIDNPALLCQAGQQLDGQLPPDDELRALRLSLSFAYIDRNPRRQPGTQEGWEIVTADNAELYAWPIDLEQGRVTLSSGELVETKVGGYKISDRDLVLRPPLDLHLPAFARSPDPLVLTGVYETVLRSLRSPGKTPTADQIRVAIEWFEKAWLNTRAIQWPERLVYLKTAFEALTGTSENWKSAKRLRKTFEALPHNTAKGSKILVWSPEEQPAHRRDWRDKNGQTRSEYITDLEQWFFAFGKARNTIIHTGALPEPEYYCSNPAYNGPFFFTAEYLLRGVIKVMLSNLDCKYRDAWQSDLRRVIKAACEGGEV